MHDSHPALKVAFDSACDYLDHLDTMPVAPKLSLDDLRARFQTPLPQSGEAPESVVHDLAVRGRDGVMGSATGRFFAFVIGGTLPAALGADWLTSTWDMNAAMYTPGPVAAVLEEIAGTWLKELLGVPRESAFAFVTGAQMANTTCLAAARNAVLAQFGWDVEANGLIGAPDLRVLCPETRHGSIDRALRFLGIGSGRMIPVPCDHAGRVLENGFRSALDRCGKVPLIVTLQAGDINTGEFDDFTRLIPIAKQHSAWVHIDGAFGLWAAVSSKYRHLLTGADAADSWCVDGHKWLNVPYDCGYSFVRNSEALRNAMGLHASYLVHSTSARDQLDWNPEFSRRGRGIPTYAAIRQLGRQGIIDLVERCCAHAYAIVARLGEMARVEVMHRPTLNQGVVRFLDPKSTVDSVHDAYTDRIIAAVAQSGEAYFSGTNFHGRRAMRVSVSNWRTSASDVDRVIHAFAKALEEQG